MQHIFHFSSKNHRYFTIKIILSVPLISGARNGYFLRSNLQSSIFENTITLKILIFKVYGYQVIDLMAVIYNIISNKILKETSNS